MDNSFEDLKIQAAEKAVEYLQDGMIVGLGSGSTTRYAIKKIGELLNSGQLHNIRGIPSSLKTEAEAHSLEIPLTTLEKHPVLDITIDGADEVNPKLNLIKGGGGALLREKILAQASRRVIIIVDESKLSPQLGTKWAVPMEVIEFGYKPVFDYLESLGAKVKMRKDEGGALYKTDQGNIILDSDFGAIQNLGQLARDLNSQAAIVENGLFLGLASEVIVAGSNGIRHLTHDLTFDTRL